ncbi:MAG: VWA domain-containing protein [Nitrososphaerales archaeon]
MKSKKRVSIAVISLFILPLLFTSVPITPIVKATTTTSVTQIGLCIDGSGSISISNWNIIKSGIANAVQDTLPKDGSIELTIVQFGGTTARVELSPTIITESNVGSVVNKINAMSKMGGTTPMAAGLSLIWNTMRNSPNFATAKKQIINLITDGNPNVPSPSSNARSQVISVRNTAVSQGLDELDVEAIGTNVDINWLKNVAYPNGVIVSISDPTPWPAGWVLPISKFEDFSVAISKKFEMIISPIEVSLTIEKFAIPSNNSYVEPKDEIIYTITYKNTGNTKATNVVITETYDPFVNFVSANPYPSSGNNVWSIGDLDQGAFGSIMVVVQVSSNAEDGQEIKNIASIDSDQTDSIGSLPVIHIVQKPIPPGQDGCPCEELLKEIKEEVSNIEAKLDNEKFGLPGIQANFTQIFNLIGDFTVNDYGWTNIVGALTDIKSEIEEILNRLGEAPQGSTGTIWGDIDRIWSLTGNYHNWANLASALDDIKNEIERIDGGATVSITKLDVRIPEQGDVGQDKWAAIWDLDAGPKSTDDLFFFLIITRADNGQPMTGLTTSDFSVTFYDKDDATITQSLTVASVTGSGGVYRIVLSSNELIKDDGVLKVTVTKNMDSKTFTGTILIAVKGQGGQGKP